MTPVAPTTWSAKGEAAGAAPSRRAPARPQGPQRRLNGEVLITDRVPTGTNQSGCTAGPSISRCACSGRCRPLEPGQQRRRSSTCRGPPDHLDRLLPGDGPAVDGQEGRPGRPGPRTRRASPSSREGWRTAGTSPPATLAGSHYGQDVPVLPGARPRHLDGGGEGDHRPARRRRRTSSTGEVAMTPQCLRPGLVGPGEAAGGPITKREARAQSKEAQAPR